MKKTKIVPIDQVEPNDYNYNKMSEDQIQNELKSLQEFGVVRSIITYQKEKGGKYIIVDGEHRYRLLKEQGVGRCPVRNLGVVPEPDAKLLSVSLNEIRGQTDYIKMADLFSGIKMYSIENMAEILPFGEDEIQAIIDSADFDWDEYDFGEDYEETKVTDFATINCRIKQDEADLIEQKANKLCIELGFNSDKESVQLGYLMEHLLEKRVS